MTALSHPNSFTAGTTIVAADVNANFTATRTAVNGQLSDDNMASSFSGYSTYKTLLVAQSVLHSDAAAGSYPLTNAVVAPDASGTIVVTAGVTHAAPPTIYFDDADYTASGRTQKLRVRAQVSTNGTQPTINFTFGLYPVTWGGGADALSLGLGTVVSGSTVAIASPAADLTTQGNSGDFTIPSDGQYMLAVATSAILTNNSAALVSAQLQTRHV